MNISKHISYNEATFSTTATRKGISNTPSSEQLRAMKLVAEKCFEPLRKYMSKPIKINSFFRSEKLNKAVGGSTTSSHCKGQAIDISLHGENWIMFDFIRTNLKFSQLIWEFGNDSEPDWIHISYDEKNLKNQVLRAVRSGRSTIYKPF